MSKKDITIKDVTDLDYLRVENDIISFIREHISEAKAKGVVIGLSGGIDSAVAFTLACRALGSDKVYAIIMPSKTTPKSDNEDASSLIRDTKATFFIESIDRIESVYQSQLLNPFGSVYWGLRDYGKEARGTLAYGNLKARIRMSILYYYANLENLLVLGTGDRSELLLGYFTKYGDGGVDLLPLGNLYKTQVRELAKRLGIPKGIINKPSSPQLWGGQTAERELGATYEEIDKVLYATHSLGMGSEAFDVSKITGVRKEVVDMVRRRWLASEHKRYTPPMLAM